MYKDSMLCGMAPIARRGDLHHFADRLDSMGMTVLVDELNGASSKFGAVQGQSTITARRDISSAKSRHLLSVWQASPSWIEPTTAGIRIRWVTANIEVAHWLREVAHQRVHGTTRLETCAGLAGRGKASAAVAAALAGRYD